MNPTTTTTVAEVDDSFNIIQSDFDRYAKAPSNVHSGHVCTRWGFVIVLSEQRKLPRTYLTFVHQGKVYVRHIEAYYNWPELTQLAKEFAEETTLFMVEVTEGETAP